MKKDLTELIFILDRSGSMGGLESDTIGGYNSMLEKQKAMEGDCYITTAIFDNNYQLIHDRINIKGVKPLTDREYYVGGTTALLDAIGITINKIVQAQKHTSEDYQADKVIFVIITDGEENSSREYSHKKVKELIENQKNSYGWEFIFLGANIDAEKSGESFGIDRDRAVSYIPDSQGTKLNYRAMGDLVSDYRREGRVDSSYLDEIRQDIKKRGGKK